LRDEENPHEEPTEPKWWVKNKWRVISFSLITAGLCGTFIPVWLLGNEQEFGGTEHFTDIRADEKTYFYVFLEKGDVLVSNFLISKNDKIFMTVKFFTDAQNLESSPVATKEIVPRQDPSVEITAQKTGLHQVEIWNNLSPTISDVYYTWKIRHQTESQIVVLTEAIPLASSFLLGFGAQWFYRAITRKKN